MHMRPSAEDDHRAVQYLRVKALAREAGPEPQKEASSMDIVGRRADKEDAEVSMLDAMEVNGPQI